MLKLFLILVIIEYYVFAVYLFGHHQQYIIIWFAPCAGKMNQILGCDFDGAILPAQDYPPCPARQSLAKLFNFFVCNPCQSSPSLTILVPLWFTITSLMFFYLCYVLFSSFLQFNGNFVDAQNNSKYRDWSPSGRRYITIFSSVFGSGLVKTTSVVAFYSVIRARYNIPSSDKVQC